MGCIVVYVICRVFALAAWCGGLSWPLHACEKSPPAKRTLFLLLTKHTFSASTRKCDLCEMQKDIGLAEHRIQT